MQEEPRLLHAGGGDLQADHQHTDSDLLEPDSRMRKIPGNAALLPHRQILIRSKLRLCILTPNAAIKTF